MISVPKHNPFKDASKLQEFNEVIKATSSNLQQKIGPNSGLIKVILTGITGSGKSTISCCLSQKQLIVRSGKGRRLVLEGEGVQSGCQSVTRDPSITIDSVERIIYIDCAGWEDTDGFGQEMINAFVMNSLFETNNNCDDNKFKILLVISDPEICSGRAKGILSNIQRLEEIFVDHDTLKKGVGLAITKSQPDYTGLDYIDQLSENASSKLLEWCEFFRNNEDHIFLFPKPTVDDVNQPYQFDDHERLNQFLKTDLIINPAHRISLNENAKLQMENLRISHSCNISNKLHELCNKIDCQFRKESKISDIDKWIDVMHQLIKFKINNANDFAKVIKNNIPNSELYEEEIQSFSEFEAFDSFIYKVLGTKHDDSCLGDAIFEWVHSSLIELERNKTNATFSEFQKEKIEQQHQMLEDQKNREIQNQQKINELHEILNQRMKTDAELSERIKTLQEENNRPRVEYVDRRVTVCNIA